MPSPSEVEIERDLRCPACKGPVADEAVPASSWILYRCQNKPFCEWWGPRAGVGSQGRAVAGTTQLAQATYMVHLSLS